MHPSIESQRAAIQELCRRFGVRRLELFGSAARDDFDERASDVDFLVEFQPGPVSTAPDRYFGLLHGLEDRLLRRVDLVMTSAVDNPYFLVAIERDRTLLYAA
ncbi:MAG: nucleotidyltransferase domain-containing protein [Planctomycetes bacterium]|nr:nucleotidyltransferase domain-containing protein [Planctomycetota bacterium]